MSLKENRMSVKEKLNSERYELVAPDGGWGYVVWIAITILLIVVTAFMPCIGMIYNEIYIQLKMDSTSINLLNGVGSVSISVAGFFTGPLLACLSLRKLGLIAAIILNLGTFTMVFVNSKELFFFANGILQSLGNGVLVNLTYTTLNQYYVKKRMLTAAVTQTITSVVSLFTPQFVKWSSDEYGYRGTLILISGVYMQAFIGIILIQPVKWHLKQVEIKVKVDDQDNELKKLLNNEETTKEKTISTTKVSNTETLLSVPAEKKELDNNVGERDAKKNSVFREMFRDFKDIPFLKSFLLSNASIGLALSAFSDVIFTIMLPQALYFMEWTESQVAWAVSLSNFGDLIIKVVFILFNSILLKFGSSEIYIIGLVVAFFTRLGMLWTDNPSVMLTFIVMIGMARSIMAIVLPLVIGDSVAKEKFTSAMGIFMLLYGTIFLILGPLIGAVRDLTNSYGTAFYIITSCYGIVTLFWLIELLYKKNKGKRMEASKSHEAA